MLDQTILQGVIGKRDETSTGSEQTVGVAEEPFEALKLAVDRDTQRLESPRGGMVARRAPDHAGDECGKRCGIVQLAASLGRDDGARDPSRLRFLAVLTQDAPQLRFADRMKPCTEGNRRAAIHAHVERTLTRERESTLGFVELKRRDTEIEENPVDCVPPEPL